MNTDDYIRLAESLFSEMRTHEGGWNELREKILPKALTDAHPEGLRLKPTKKYCSVANKALLTLASAHMTYITPMNQRWFSLKSRNEKVSGKTETWFSKATEVVLKTLAASNFYTAIHQLYIDRCLTGTGCMFAEAMRPGKIVFKHIPTGTYAVAEGEDGYIDTLVRKFRLTAHQAARNFGLKSLSDKLKGAYEDVKRRYTDKFEFYHIVVPRDSYKFGSNDLKPEQRRWTDLYIEVESKAIVQSGGFYEFPFLVSRFMRCGDQAYGDAPGINVLPEIDGVILMRRILDTLGQVAAFPRILTLAEQVGEVDMRAGGRTVITPEAAALHLPKEWGTQGRYDIGMDRLKDYEDKISSGFYADMIQVISSVDRQMTATEVNARESEKVLAFFPSFTLFASDMQPHMLRIFSMLLRMGKLPDDPPAELFTMSVDGKKYEINTPVVNYLGKIAQAVERIQRYGLEGAIQTLINLVSGTKDQRILKALRVYKILRFIWEASGAPIDCLMTEDEFNKLMEQDDRVAKLQQELELLKSQSETARNNASVQQAV